MGSDAPNVACGMGNDAECDPVTTRCPPLPAQKRPWRRAPRPPRLRNFPVRPSAIHHRGFHPAVQTRPKPLGRARPWRPCRHAARSGSSGASPGLPRTKSRFTADGAKRVPPGRRSKSSPSRRSADNPHHVHFFQRVACLHLRRDAQLPDPLRGSRAATHLLRFPRPADRRPTDAGPHRRRSPPGSKPAASAVRTVSRAGSIASRTFAAGCASLTPPTASAHPIASGDNARRPPSLFSGSSPEPRLRRRPAALPGGRASARWPESKCTRIRSAGAKPTAITRRPDYPARELATADLSPNRSRPGARRVTARRKSAPWSNTS